MKGTHDNGKYVYDSGKKVCSKNFGLLTEERLILFLAYFFNRYIENMGQGAINYIENRLDIMRGSKHKWEAG